VCFRRARATVTRIVLNTMNLLGTTKGANTGSTISPHGGVRRSVVSSDIPPRYFSTEARAVWAVVVLKHRVFRFFIVVVVVRGVATLAIYGTVGSRCTRAHEPITGCLC